MVPSQVPELIWSNTDGDIRTKIRLKLGIEKARASENFEALCFVVSKALGGGSKQMQPVQTGDDAAAAFKNVVGAGAVVTNLPSGVDPFKGLDGCFGDKE